MNLWNFKRNMSSLCHKHGFIFYSSKDPRIIVSKKREVNLLVLSLIDKHMKNHATEIVTNQLTVNQLFNIIFPRFDELEKLVKSGNSNILNISELIQKCPKCQIVNVANPDSVSFTCTNCNHKYSTSNHFASAKTDTHNYYLSKYSDDNIEITVLKTKLFFAKYIKELYFSNCFQFIYLLKSRNITDKHYYIYFAQDSDGANHKKELYLLIKVNTESETKDRQLFYDLSGFILGLVPINEITTKYPIFNSIKKNVI